MIPEYPMTRAERCPFDPPPALRELREEGPIGKVRIWDGSTAWMVTGYAQQRALLADPRVSADINRPGYPGFGPRAETGVTSVSFILMDDPEHARLRRMVTGPFAVRRVEEMRPGVQRIVDELIDAMLAGPNPVDLVEAFALPVPSLVICQLLGVPYRDHDFFQANSKQLIRRTTSPEERGEAFGRLKAYLDDLIDRKLAEPGADLLSRLTGLIERGELTRDGAAEMGVLLLIAGHETTANMIALGTLALLENPEQLAALRGSGDPALIANAVEELLRYLNITHNGRRRVATEDIPLDGQLIRAGDGIILANDVGNRDAEVFENPDQLEVRREGARRHVAFGFGVHQCLGQNLARMELQVAYGTLYRRMPTLALATPLSEIPFKHDGAVYGVYELPVRW